MNRVVCMGELLIDFTANSLGKIRDVAAFEKNPGGAPANVAVCVAKLGGKSAMITQLGDDEFGRFLLGVLTENGVDTSGVFFTKKANTPLAFVSLDESGERDFEFYRNPSSDLFLAQSQITESIVTGSIFHFGSVDLVDFPVRGAHEKAIFIARKKGMLVSFDPNLRYNLWPDRTTLLDTVRKFIPLADIVKLNLEELLDITGMTDETSAVEDVKKMGVKLLFVTKGGDGADAYFASEKVHADAIKCPSIDTTGAGDTFMGAMLFQLQRNAVTSETIASLGRDAVAEFLLRAAKAAAVSVTRRGAIPAMPTYSEVFN